MLERFANRVILFIDPKFNDDDPDDQFSDFNIAKSKLIDYGKRSELTEQEYLLALDFASKGFLILDDQKIKIFREINQINLAEIEAGYIEFRAKDQKHQNSKDEIKMFLNPPAPKMTDEEFESMTFENIRKDYNRFKADGKVLASPIFYDLIKKERGSAIKLQFVENFLKNYVPETAEGKITSDGTALPKVIKKDAYVEFQHEMIKNYVIHLKLNETSEELWMQHWKRLYQKKAEVKT